MLQETLASLALTGALSALLPGVVGSPPATPPPPPEIPVVQHQLPNGLTVLLSEDHSLPVVAVEVRYLVGSANERRGRSGFAHLFEHLMFQGSGHHDREYFEPFEPIGGDVNGTTSQDRTNYYERVPAQYLDLSLWMQSDRLGAFLPVLTQQKLDNQRDVVKNERRQRYENAPYGMFHSWVLRELFPEGHPYHEDVIGSHADLTAASLEDVGGFFREYYAPANAVVTVVGDVAPAHALERITHYFGGIPGGRRSVPPVATTVPVAVPVHRVKTDDVKLPRVYLAWVTPALYQAGDAELDLFSSLLTQGKTSRLFQPLVYEKKVAKDVGAYQASMRLGSYFVVQATAAPGVEVEVLARELQAALAAALAREPSPDELDRAKAGFRKGFYENLESVLGRAQLLSTYFHVAGDPGYLARDLARYQDASAAGVAAAARQHLDPAHLVRIDIVPGARAGGGS